MLFYAILEMSPVFKLFLLPCQLLLAKSQHQVGLQPYLILLLRPQLTGEICLRKCSFTLCLQTTCYQQHGDLEKGRLRTTCMTSYC